MKTDRDSIESGNPIRILLVDDHALVRAGIRTLLEKRSNIEVVGEASDGLEAIRLVEKLEPDIVIMDLAMPVLNGFRVTRHLARTFPRVRVVILSMYSDEEYVYLAVRAGAAGYLLKGASAEQLRLAVKTVAQGGTYHSPSVSETMIMKYRDLADTEESLLRSLSPRQVEVLKLVAEGKTTKQIALELNISVKTVETHRMTLMERLDIYDIPGLVRFAIRVGLVTLEN